MTQTKYIYIYISWVKELPRGMCAGGRGCVTCKGGVRCVRRGGAAAGADDRSHHKGHQYGQLSSVPPGGGMSLKVTLEGRWQVTVGRGTRTFSSRGPGECPRRVLDGRQEAVAALEGDTFGGGGSAGSDSGAVGSKSRGRPLLGGSDRARSGSGSDWRV